MSNPLDELKGGSISVNGTDMPDRKTLDITSGIVVATDDERDNSTTLTIGIVGTTANRPVSPTIGDSYFDTTLGIPIWYDGADWVNFSGVAV
jgi:hypothetical protein